MTSEVTLIHTKVQLSYNTRLFLLFKRRQCLKLKVKYTLQEGKPIAISLSGGSTNDSPPSGQREFLQLSTTPQLPNTWELSPAGRRPGSHHFYTHSTWWGKPNACLLI